MKRKFVFGLTIISVALWIVSCGGGGGGSESSPPPTPSISTQDSLDFDVAVLGRTSSRQLLISNVGSGTLEMGQLSLSMNSAFQITSDDCSGKSIAPQANCSVTLQLTPTTQADYSATLTIPSNDTAHNPVAVALTGKGRALNVEINEVKRDACEDISKMLKLLVSVTNAVGTPVTGLTSDCFTIFENGIQAPINGLTPPISTPISVDLVLDYSGSLPLSDQLAIQDAAKSFVAKLVNGVDEAGVVKFARTIGAKTEFTTDQSVLNTALDAPYPGDTGGTILYDALIAAIDDTALRTNSRKAIIVFSDGFDEESTNTLTDVINSANLKGIPIYTIAYTNAPDPKPEIMQQLAQQTGGEYFLAGSSLDVAGIYDQIAEILSQQYLLEYISPSAGGATISLHVEVDDNGDLGEDTKEATGC